MNAKSLLIIAIFHCSLHANSLLAESMVFQFEPNAAAVEIVLVNKQTYEVRSKGKTAVDLRCKIRDLDEGEYVATFWSAIV